MFQKLVNKIPLLLGPNREPTSSEDESDKISVASTSDSSSSSSSSWTLVEKVSSQEQPPSPSHAVASAAADHPPQMSCYYPSAAADSLTATAAARATTTRYTSILSSHEQLADVLFQMATFRSESGSEPESSDDRSQLVLTEHGKSTLYVYYCLFKCRYATITRSEYSMRQHLPHYRAEGSAATLRAVYSAAGNYAFMLALLHASKQYDLDSLHPSTTNVFEMGDNGNWVRRRKVPDCWREGMSREQVTSSRGA